MKLLIWDFDGTLGYRHGMWSGALMEIIDACVPGHNIERDMVKAGLRDGFPWHTPDQPRAEIQTADQWWLMMTPLFKRVFTGVGFTATEAQTMALQIRTVYPRVDLWHCYDDVLPTLRELSDLGWTHVVLSNHAPELEDIMAHMGLTAHMAAIFNSAFIGYEKPNPQAFHAVLDQFSKIESVWMIGDNPIADIAGAKAVGIPGMLARKEYKDAPYVCTTLFEISSIIIYPAFAQLWSS